MRPNSEQDLSTGSVLRRVAGQAKYLAIPALVTGLAMLFLAYTYAQQKSESARPAVTSPEAGKMEKELLP